MPISEWRKLFPGVELTELSTDEVRLADFRGRFADSSQAVRSTIAQALRTASERDVPLVLVVNDPHRFTDTRAFLEVFFDVASRAGPTANAVPLRLLVAAGTHKSEAFERSAHEEKMASSWLVRFGEIAWHDADDGLVDVGGLGFNRWMAGGAVCLACGSMEPHYFAGVTGAHKTLTVGVMSRAAIEANHAGAMRTEAAGLRLDGNPVHEGIVAAIDALEAHGTALFAVNQVIVDGELAAWTAGHPLTALQDGLSLVRNAFGFCIEAQVDLVLARMAPPLDRDLYQADKGIKNTEAAVRNAGVVVLEAGCQHGVGIDHFVELLRAAPTHARALEVVAERGYRLGDHKAVRLRALTDARGVSVGLVAPGVDPSLESVLGMRVFADRNTAATWAAGLLPRQGARGLLVDDAGNKTLEIA